MANVRIVVDSTSDLPKDVRERLGIEMVPLKVHFGNQTFLDSVTLASGEFFDKLSTERDLPTTSQPSPVDFVEVYKKLLEEPDTAIISLHLSSAFSGTYQSAVLAKSLLGGDHDIAIVDTKSASIGIGMLATAAAEAAANGADAQTCLARIEQLKKETQLYFLVDTLEFLHRNGRIGKASAVFGSLLNIKPILSIDDEGVIFPVDKIRGSRKAMSRIVELLRERYGDAEVDARFVHANSLGAAEEFAGIVQERLSVRQVSHFELGPVIGTHVGPGTLGVFVTPSAV